MEGYDNADWTLGRILATENYMAFASFPGPILIFWMGPENEASTTSSKCIKINVILLILIVVDCGV